ncbi:MAG: DUF308 domain-containing protein [Chloroflexi bacterium]|nr:DUF308 domain-containing protein [Chloroflexota bacterium]
MLQTLVKNWWLIALRGLVALILGIIMLAMQPVVAAAFLVIFIGAYALVDGIFALAVGIINRPPHRDRGWLITEGIIGVLAGIAILASPLLAGVFIMYFIAFWAIFTGLMEFVFAIGQWKQIPDAWLILLNGIFSVALGTLILVNVAVGATLIVLMIAIYLVIFGVLLIAMGFSLKGADIDKLGQSGLDVK